MAFYLYSVFKMLIIYRMLKSKFRTDQDLRSGARARFNCRESTGEMDFHNVKDAWPDMQSTKAVTHLLFIAAHCTDLRRMVARVKLAHSESALACSWLYPNSSNTSATHAACAGNVDEMSIHFSRKFNMHLRVHNILMIVVRVFLI